MKLLNTLQVEDFVILSTFSCLRDFIIAILSARFFRCVLINSVDKLSELYFITAQRTNTTVH